MQTLPKDISTANLITILAPITLPATTEYRNWSRTYHCSPLTIFVPETEYQCELVLELAKRNNKTLRASGVGHSPSDIACTSGYLIRTLKLDRLLEVNVEQKYVVLQAGMTLEKLHLYLDQNGLAMSNMGSISDQTIGGVTTVATHGTGINFKVIPTYVLSFILLLADGTKIRCSRDEHPDLFLATLCGFGATGLVLQVQLRVEPAFRLRESQEILPFRTVISKLDTLVYGAQHVRLWWFPSADKVVVGNFDRVYESPEVQNPSRVMNFVGFHLVQLLLLVGRYLRRAVPLAGRLALRMWFNQNPSVNIDLSYRIFNLDCKYRQFTTEWAIPYDQASHCLQEVHSWLLKENGDPHGLRPHFPIEIRFSDEDDIYLSPSNGRKTCWIGIVQHKPYGLPVPYRRLFQNFEDIMMRHFGRPHWSKAHPLGPKQLSQMYPKFGQFVDVLRTYDPKGVFRNEYVRRHVFGEDVAERIFKQRSRMD